MRQAGIVAFLTVILVAPVARAGDGVFVPPAKVDVGYLTFASAGRVYGGLQWMAGLNWATIYPRRTRFDVGVGYVGAVVSDPRAARAGAHDFDRIAAAPDPDRLLTLHGGYLELSTRVASGAHWRTWLSTRGELLAVDGAGALGGAARLSTEVWGGTAGAGRDAAIVGVLAVGVWVEASARELGDRAVVAAASAGMSLRVPLILVGR